MRRSVEKAERSRARGSAPVSVVSQKRRYLGAARSLLSMILNAAWCESRRLR
jgi:hypothetical protein